jgi:hypothetical protein
VAPDEKIKAAEGEGGTRERNNTGHQKQDERQNHHRLIAPQRPMSAFKNFAEKESD